MRLGVLSIRLFLVKLRPREPDSASPDISIVGNPTVFAIPTVDTFRGRYQRALRAHHRLCRDMWKRTTRRIALVLDLLEASSVKTTRDEPISRARSS
jgi:hypothetical protein